MLSSKEECKEEDFGEYVVVSPLSSIEEIVEFEAPTISSDEQVSSMEEDVFSKEAVSSKEDESEEEDEDVSPEENASPEEDVSSEEDESEEEDEFEEEDDVEEELESVILEEVSSEEELSEFIMILLRSSVSFHSFPCLNSHDFVCNCIIAAIAIAIAVELLSFQTTYDTFF